MTLLSFTGNRRENACVLFILERQTFVGLSGKCLSLTQNFSLFLLTIFFYIFSLLFSIYLILPSTKHTLSHTVVTAILPNVEFQNYLAIIMTFECQPNDCEVIEKKIKCLICEFFLFFVLETKLVIKTKLINFEMI